MYCYKMRYVENCKRDLKVARDASKAFIRGHLIQHNTQLREEKRRSKTDFG